MRQTTLATLTPSELADAFNAVYAQYVVPFAVTAASVQRHITATDIRLDASPLWQDDAGNVVALAALGVRGERGWVGGFGVAAAYRGQGISHALIAALLDSARGLSLHQVALEVLVQNSRAIRTYQRAGFVQRRDLRTLECDAPMIAAGEEEVRDAEPRALLARRERIRPLPPWQREPSSLEGLPELRGLVLGAPEAAAGLLLYTETARAVAIVDIAVAEQDAVAPLIGAFAARSARRSMRLVNEPAESPVCAALDAMGWTERLRQHEMVILLRS